MLQELAHDDPLPKLILEYRSRAKLKSTYTDALYSQIDELVFEVTEDAVTDVQAVVVAQMEEAAELSVPLKVDAGVGKNWNQAH